LTDENNLYIRTEDDEKFYKFELRDEKSIKKLDINHEQKYGYKAYSLQWFPKSKEFSTCLDGKIVFLDQNLDKKERSDTFNQTELDYRFRNANGESLSADGKYAVFNDIYGTVYVYSILNSCIET